MSNDLKIIIIGRIVQIAITLLSMRLLTTLLSPEEVGNYYLLLAVMAFFNLVLLHPVGVYIARHLLSWQRSKQVFNVFSVFIGWSGLVAFIAMGISLFFYTLLEYENKYELTILLIYVSGSIFIGGIHRYILFGTNTLGFRKEFVKYLLMTLILGLILSTTIVEFYYPYALGWLIGVLLSELCLIYFIFRYFIQDNKLSIHKIKTTLTQERFKNILIFTFPIAITSFLMWGQTIAYRFVVDRYYSAEVLAYIAVGLGVATSVFGSVESIVQQYFNPIFLRNILDATKEQRAESWNNIAQQVVPIYLFTAFFTFALAEVLINILVDHKFHDAYIYVMVGVIIEFFRVMSNLLNNVAQSEYKTKSTVKPYIVGFIISLGILTSMDFSNNYIMIPIVLAIAYASVYVYMYFSMKSILRIKYNVNWVKIFFISLPFGMIYFINVGQYSVWFNLLVLIGFGVYYVFVVWLTLKDIDK